MESLKLLILILGLSVLQPFRAIAETDTITIIQNVTYDTRKASISYNHGKLKVSYDNDMTFNTVGETILPYEQILISVPYNAKNFHVELLNNSYSYIYINNRDSLQLQNSWTIEPIDSASVLRSYYPTYQCEIKTSGYIFGDNQIVKVWISPFTFSPSGVLRLSTNADIKLTCEIDNSIIPTVIRYDAETKTLDFNTMRHSIINANSLANNSYIFNPNNQIPVVTPSPNALPTYEYCIITSRALASAFKKIIAMKRQKGIYAGVVCIEDIMASPDYNGGDNQGGSYVVITDTAGVVRQYLKYAFQAPENATRYVLMGGKAPYAPVRYAFTNIDNSISSSHVSTDMYFSNLSFPWVHRSSVYDLQYEKEYEIDDSIETYSYIYYTPDIIVGRLLCTTKEDINNYSDKLYKYVFCPGNGDCSFLSNALFANMIIGNTLADMVNNYCNNTFGQIDHLYNVSENLTGSQFVDYLNNNKYGFLSIHAHGEPQSIQMNYAHNDAHHLITALDRNVIINGSYEENGNGLDCLLNKNYPLICYSTSCTTMPYDKAQSFCGSTQFENNSYNFGASFTLGKDYGGPAYLGNTRNHYSNSEYELEIYFLNTLFDRKIYKIGTAEAFSKIIYDNNNYYFNHTMLTHNLLGDPEFDMWTEEPQRYEGISIIHNPVGFYIYGLNQSDTLAYCDNDGNIGKLFNLSNFEYINYVSNNSSIMIYNHDHIPYIAPLMLQDCDINNSQYVYASSFSAGRNIVPVSTNGNVTIKNGAVYEIEATDDVHLGEGFIVENGATFAVRTPGKVTIDGCVFQSGAKVKIESGTVEIVGKFTAELGSMVEFKQFVD